MAMKLKDSTLLRPIVDALHLTIRLLAQLQPVAYDSFPRRPRRENVSVCRWCPGFVQRVCGWGFLTLSADDHFAERIQSILLDDIREEAHGCPCH